MVERMNSVAEIPRDAKERGVTRIQFYGELDRVLMRVTRIDGPLIRVWIVRDRWWEPNTNQHAEALVQELFDKLRDRR